MAAILGAKSREKKPACIFVGYRLVKFGADTFPIQGDTECDRRADRRKDRQADQSTDRQTV